ncbi:MAG: hypothetical protein V3U95_08105 [Dehalococcoidia bacterium]
MAFGSDTLTASPGEEIRTALIVHPLGNGISAAEIRLRFDTATVELVSMTPGDLAGRQPRGNDKQRGRRYRRSTVCDGAKGDHYCPYGDGRATDSTVESPLQGAAVGFHSVQLALAELVDESSELIPNVDVKPLIVNVR